MASLPWDKILTKVGNRAGQAVGAATGAVQLIKARGDKKRAMEATPQMVDPNQAAFLAELQQKKNALNTGSQYTSSLDAINDKMAQTQDVLAGNSGGDAGGTISALLKSQQVANQGQGQILAQGQQSEGMYNGLFGDLLNKMAQRKLELGLLSRAQNMTEWAQNKQHGSANFLAGAQSFLDWKGGDKKATNPAVGAPVSDTNQTASSDSNSSFANNLGNLRQGVEGFNIGDKKPNQFLVGNGGGSAPFKMKDGSSGTNFMSKILSGFGK